MSSIEERHEAWVNELIAAAKDLVECKLATPFGHVVNRKDIERLEKALEPFTDTEAKVFVVIAGVPIQCWGYHTSTL